MLLHVEDTPEEDARHSSHCRPSAEVEQRRGGLEGDLFVEEIPDVARVDEVRWVDLPYRMWEGTEIQQVPLWGIPVE